MIYKHNKALVPVARMLRKNMTKEEKHLWYDFLRTHHIKFTRQKILGNYIVDFYSAQLKLVIEIDGIQHYTTQGKEYDAKRSEFLSCFGLIVLRIPNTMINHNFQEATKQINKFITTIQEGAYNDPSDTARV